MGRYIDSGQIVSLMPALISTSALTPGQIEFFIETVEDEIDGRVGRIWNTAPFSGNAPPMFKTLTKLGTSVAIRSSLISLEDPSVSGWIKNDQERFDDLLTQLADGTLDMVTSSGTIIARAQPKSAQFWSSTKDYAPTRNVLDSTEQRVSPTRIQDALDDQEADS